MEKKCFVCEEPVEKHTINGCPDLSDSSSSAWLSDIENHPQFENFIRAFWRRIDMYKNDYGKELPEKLPVEFRASMATAFLTFTLGEK